MIMSVDDFDKINLDETQCTTTSDLYYSKKTDKNI